MTAVILAAAAVLVATVALILTNPARARAFPGVVAVAPDDLADHVTALAGGDRFRSFADPEALDAAASYIRDRWAAWGYAVEEQPFTVGGVVLRNLIVRRGPEDGPLVVLGAHYDVCGEQSGADDNASAVAVLLEVSRLLVELAPPLDSRIEMVAYTLEEPPFFRTAQMGSMVHAADLAARGVTPRAMLCLEMLGYYSDAPRSQEYPAPGLSWLYPSTGDFVAVVGNLGGLRLTRAVKSRLAGACAVPVRSINAPAAIPGVDFSDHLSYWKHGWPAVMVTDTAFYRNPNYHCVTDTPDSLDYRRLAEVTRGVYAAVITL